MAYNVVCILLIERMADLAMALGFIGAAVISIIVISNPMSTSAIFIVLTSDMSRDEKLKVARKSAEYALGILVFFSITGLLVFQLFGFSIGAFKIAGGILLFSTSVSMLSPASRYEAAGEKSSDISLIPLAIPFISGPGTIVTVVLLMSDAQEIAFNDDLAIGMLAIFGVYLGISATILISYFMMKRSDLIDRVLREGGRKVITRLFGLLVMAIAVQFVINGIKDILPEFVELLSLLVP